MNNEYIFITDGYKGGANTFMNDHMEYLISMNKKVILFDKNPKKTFEKLNKKISVHKVNFAKNKQEIIKNIQRRIDSKKSKKIYLMITNFSFLIKFYFFFKNLDKSKIKIILTIHSGILNFNLKNYAAGFLFSLIYNKLDYLFFGSNSAKSWWKYTYPWMNIKDSRIHLNGVKLKKNLPLKEIKNDIQVSFAGRLEKENNPEFFIKIAFEYLKNNKKGTFNIFGDGPLLKLLKKKYKAKNILFHGWVKKDDIYKITNIIVITSPINNFPYVALEAKSYGIPIVSCSKGDIKKIITNSFDGYLDYTNSVNKMINFLEKIKKNYKKFSRNSLSSSRNFELSNSCKKFWKSVNV